MVLVFWGIKVANFCQGVLLSTGSYTQAGFYLGFIVWGRNPEWAKAVSFLGGRGGGTTEMQSGAF